MTTLLTKGLAVGSFLALGTTLTAATPVFAQDTPAAVTDTAPAAAGGTSVKGWYFTASGTLTHKRDRASDVGLGTAAEFKNGFAINGGVGYRFPLGMNGRAGAIRIEGERSYQNNANKNFVILGSPETKFASRGNVNLNSYMANIYYDVNIPSVPKLKPYIGYGIGTYQSQINGFTTADPTAPLGASGVILDTSSTQTPAHQYRVGLAYAVDSKTDVFIGYRAFYGNVLHFVFAVPPGPSPFNPGTTTAIVPLPVSNNKTESFEVGVHVNF